MRAPSVRLPDRLDRHVRRGHIRIGADESRQRVEFALQEALRLAELPGEREGRVYYFRRVSMGAIQARASRQSWMAGVQSSLDRLAATAVHGRDARAAAAEAVYFDGQEQALEWALRRALRSGAPAPWFAAAVSGRAGDANPIARPIERLCELAVPPAACASLILSALGDLDPVRLLGALSVAAVSNWLRRLDGAESSERVHLPDTLIRRVQRVARSFGWSEPRTVWLTALAVLTVRPAMHAQHAAPVARGILWRLAAADSRAISDSAPPVHMTEARAVGHGVILARNARAGEDESRDAVLIERRAAPRPQDDAAHESRDRQGAAPAHALPQGAASAAAGLYFLLHVLRHLGIERALASCGELRAAGFVSHLFKHLAAIVGVAPEDPMMRCLVVVDDDFTLAPDVVSHLEREPGTWPQHVGLRLAALGRGRTFVRVWALAVRRWCLRHGRVTLREVVRRHGRVWLTRAELDVTMPLADADIRIRRLGLDIDPAWVPWFGEFGKVVRFHYRERLSDGELP
jgi:hypothetical protein